MRRMFVLLVLAAAVYAPTAGASQVISTSTVTGLTLGVNHKGEALLTYKQGGRLVLQVALVEQGSKGLTPPSKRIRYMGSRPAR